MALFSSVTDNIKGDDTFRDYDKSTVSKILRGERKIPSFIRDHLYDSKVELAIADYFAKSIIPLLIPNHSDLIHELNMLLDQHPRISPSHLSKIKSSANEESFHIFLSELFCYAIIEGTDDNLVEPERNKNDIQDKDREPVLSLYGITKDDSLSANFFIENFLEKTSHTKDLFLKVLRSQFKKVSDIHLTRKYSPLICKGFDYSSLIKVEIPDDVRDIICDVATHLKIEMSEDFFDLGRLTKNPLASFPLTSYGISLNGNEEEILKRSLIYELYDTSNALIEAMPFMIDFNNIKCIRLAIGNTGNIYDENVTVSLSFDKNTLLTINEISEMDQGTYDYIMDGNNATKFFGIDRGLDYLDYYSSNKAIRPSQSQRLKITSPSIHMSNSEKYRKLTPIFNYYITSSEQADIVEITFNEVIHNESIAFPSVILLKKDVESIEYTIHSKHMPNVTKGLLKVSKSRYV